MPKIEWLRKEFNYGYSSGNILSRFPNRVRRKEEYAIGGSYRRVFLNGLRPYLSSTSKVLEIGPGKGSWTRAILKHVRNGEVSTIDFQDATIWLKPEKYNCRLKCFVVNEYDYSCLEDNFYDIHWSFGVLCHNNQDAINKILLNLYKKIKPGGYAIHQYADWEKLEKYGWGKGTIPIEFKEKPDNEIWWPRNNQKTMVKIAKKTGWKIITPDIGIVKRDSIIVLKKEQYTNEKNIK